MKEKPDNCLLSCFVIIAVIIIVIVTLRPLFSIDYSNEIHWVGLGGELRITEQRVYILHRIMPNKVIIRSESVRETNCISLSANQAKNLGVRYELDSNERKELFLVRAVRLEDYGMFSYLIENGNLIIEYACHGGKPLKMLNVPVVIPLEQKPINVYTSCSMTE